MLIYNIIHLIVGLYQYADLFDVLFGLIYFMPKPPVNSASRSALKTAFPYDGNFYSYATSIATESASLKDDSDLYLPNISYDAMSLSMSVEKLRRTSGNGKFNKYDNKTWYSSFQKLCNGRCNLLTFELYEPTVRPVVNGYIYHVRNNNKNPIFSYKT